MMWGAAKDTLYSCGEVVFGQLKDGLQQGDWGLVKAIAKMLGYG